ncbi:MAG: hypothetical protein U9O20_00015 [Patescibacteria group bacterium]|nr:hypothetical protein [Patescibacteria group bacterium]
MLVVVSDLVINASPWLIRAEIVQELILAMGAKIKAKDIFSKIHPYPTASRINKSVISGLFVQKLKSKFNRKLLRALYHRALYSTLAHSE